MVRTLREFLARGGISGLALVFALAFAGVELATAIAQVAVSVISQNLSDVDHGFRLDFHIGGTRIEYTLVLQAAVTVLLVLGGLLLVWQLTRSTVRACPECLSEIPDEASVCRYCTAELGEESR